MKITPYCSRLASAWHLEYNRMVANWDASVVERYREGDGRGTLCRFGVPGGRLRQSDRRVLEG